MVKGLAYCRSRVDLVFTSIAAGRPSQSQVQTSPHMLICAQVARYVVHAEHATGTSKAQAASVSAFSQFASHNDLAVTAANLQNLLFA